MKLICQTNKQMTEKLKKYLDFFPIAVPAIYILGFIVINGHLSNYNFSDYNILNFTYLKAGILVSFIIAVVFLAMKFSFTKETMTDNLRKSWPSLAIVTYNILFITMLLSFIVIDFKDLLKNHKTAFYVFDTCFLLHAFFRIWSMGKTAKNNLGVLFLTIPSIILTLIIMLTLGSYNQTIKDILIFTSVLALVFFLAFGDFGDQNYNARIISDVVIIIGLVFFFGKNIFGKIPSKFGGGQQYEIIVANCNSINGIVNENRPMDTLSVIYENDSRLLISDKKKNILFIDKSEIKTYKIIK
jgi:hypothetical protein